VQQIKTVAEKKGIHTILTRKNDEDVPFKDRVSYKGDVFVSLHINAAPAGPLQQNANGIEIMNNPSGQGQLLSTQVANQFKNSFRQLNGINTNDSTYVKPGLYVLRENKVPAVLIEFGYASNPENLDYILNERNRYELAQKFVDAIIAYKNNKKPL
jgi:N-acetylmuramoyl-L-alanine amidase